MELIQLAEHGAWTWFHNPRAIYHRGARSKTYFTWSWKGIWIGSFDHDTGDIERQRLLATPQNDHNVAALGIRPDGRLLVCYSPHNGTMRSVVAERTEDVTAWREPTTIRAERATYPNLFHLASESRWVLVYRGGPTGAWPLWFRSSDDDGATWSEETLLFRNGTHRPYPQVVSDGSDQLHFSLTDGHPNAVPHNSIYHLHYDAGTWRDSAGSPLSRGATIRAGAAHPRLRWLRGRSCLVLGHRARYGWHARDGIHRHPVGDRSSLHVCDTAQPAVDRQRGDACRPEHLRGTW